MPKNLKLKTLFHALRTLNVSRASLDSFYMILKRVISWNINPKLTIIYRKIPKQVTSTKYCSVNCPAKKEGSKSKI
jgi:hypothetical protein